jgi:HD-like signal output (HDOD) protein/HD-GYP domain-containing protein (c-di-GMP phosphodiesterase class II)
LLFHACQLRDCGISSMAMGQRILHDWPVSEADDHSLVGSQLLAQSTLLAHLAPLVRYHHTPWQDLMKLELGRNVMILSNLIFLADRTNALIAQNLDASLKQLQKSIQQTLDGHRHRLFEPHLVDAFLTISGSDAFWQQLEPAYIQTSLAAVSNRMPAHPIDISGVHQIARLFGQVADSRSPYMEGHSLRVGQLASHLGKLTGMPEQGCALLEVAGFLHDLGKLQISDEIYNKVGALTAAERVQLDRQGLAAFRIIKRVPGLERVATWIAYQHTANAAAARNQGSSRASQPREAGILAVAEAFQAMLQERPHRQPMTPLRIASALQKMVVEGQLDSQVVSLLEQHADACWSLASGVDVAVWPTAPTNEQTKQTGTLEPTRHTEPVSEDEDDEQRLVEAVLAGSIRIPAMPAALHNLARLRANPDAGPRELATLINKDVALSGAIFRVVNSPVFHRGIKVDTIEKATAVLGMKYSEAVITSEAMRNALSDPANTQAMKVIWDHLTGVAELCVWICGKLRISGLTPENAFTVGMFHDCGVTLLCKRHPGYAKAIGLNGHFPDISSLDHEFHSSHTVLGQLVGRNWQLPPELTAVIRYHHDLAPPPLPEPANQLIALLQLALHLQERRNGADGREWASGWRDVVHERLGVNAEMLDALQEEFSQTKNY